MTKSVTTVEHWNGLVKGRQAGHWMTGHNTSYDHICMSHKDISVPLKTKFLEEITIY